MLQLFLDLSNQLFALLIDGVLGVKPFAAFGIAATFEFAALLLVG